MADAPSTWNTAGTMAWFLLFFVVLAYEIFAGIDHSVRTPMLTHVVVRYVPWWATLMFIIWLFVHFASRYFNTEYVRWLRGG